MPKTKWLRQQEAKERKLKLLPKLRQQWIDSRVGGPSYETRRSNISVDHADEMLKEAYKRFERCCKEAGVDTHGNLLEK